MMDMYKFKWTQLEASVFRFLCIKSGYSFTLRAIAKSLNASPTGVSNALKRLEKEEIVKIIKSNTMNLSSIELNRDNARTMELKRLENLKIIYESGLSEFLKDSFPGCTIVIFGSYSIGEDVWTDKIEEHSSDIDIAVIGTKGKNIDLNKFDKLLERKISINFYSSWKDIHKNLKENILRGIILKGNIEL
ncbi:MAG: winged helix-turn-helix transcriptional regulator [archaeon]|nr:winged helix-turn-helix transcriptional regulator [archaeon]